MLSGVVYFFFWLSGEVQLCTEFIDYLSSKQGRDVTAEGLEPYYEIMHAGVDLSLF